MVGTSSGMTMMRSSDTPRPPQLTREEGEFVSATFPERISLPITTMAAVVVFPCSMN